MITVQKTKSTALPFQKTKHVFIRLISYPIASAIIYVFIHSLLKIEGKGWGHAIFSAASIISLVLMAEIILFFTKKQMEKIYYNIGMIFLIFITVIATIALM